VSKEFKTKYKERKKPDGAESTGLVWESVGQFSFIEFMRMMRTEVWELELKELAKIIPKII
jgi:hypothetical protein